MHGARGVVGGNVEGFEIVVIVFDFGPVADFETGTGEKVFDTGHRERDRMSTTQGTTPTRQRDVDVRTRQFRFQLRGLQRGLALFDGSREVLFRDIDQTTGFGAIRSRQLTEILELFGEYPFLSQILHSHLIQGGQRFRLLRLAGRGFDDFVGVRHYS